MEFYPLNECIRRNKELIQRLNETLQAYGAVIAFTTP